MFPLIFLLDSLFMVGVTFYNDIRVKLSLGIIIFFFPFTFPHKQTRENTYSSIFFPLIFLSSKHTCGKQKSTHFLSFAKHSVNLFGVQGFHIYVTSWMNMIYMLQHEGECWKQHQTLIIMYVHVHREQLYLGNMHSYCK